MKKIIMGIIALSSVCSCSNSSDLGISEIKSDTKSKQTSINSKLSKNSIEEFKNDEIIPLLKDNYYLFLRSVKDNNATSLYQASLQGEKYLDQLYVKYGKDETLMYFEELSTLDENVATDNEVFKIFGTHDGSSCTRNLNGTTYWGNCSFWEGVSAYIGILVNCGHISPSDPQNVINNYYNCNQQQICKNC